jgi:hypothetical protein
MAKNTSQNISAKAGDSSASVNKLDMYYASVKVHGDLNVLGNINRSSVTQTDLHLEDKQILLGVSSESDVVESSNADGVTYTYNSSNYLVDDETMDEAGLKLNGLPKYIVESASLTTEEKKSQLENIQWEKSFTFNNPIGCSMSNLAMVSGMDTNIDTQPYWDIKGGNMRLTQFKSDNSSDFVSFGFRINSKQQLELAKITKAADGSTQNKIIAKFGAITSYNA